MSHRDRIEAILRQELAAAQQWRSTGASDDGIRRVLDAVLSDDGALLAEAARLAVDQWALDSQVTNAVCEYVRTRPNAP